MRVLACLWGSSLFMWLSVLPLRITKRSSMLADQILNDDTKNKINEEMKKTALHAGLNLGRAKSVKVTEMTHSEARQEKARAIRMHEVEEVHLSHLKEGGSGWRVQNFSSFFERDSFLKSGKTPTASEDGVSREAETDTQVDDQDDTLTPPLKVKPTLVSGNLCVQVDIDLGILSMGMFPGIFGIGLLGDIHKLPETGCYGWSNELYIQLSLYFPGLSSIFRVSFVFVGTLRIQEQPLNVAANDLTWEMPPGFDTSVCHTSSPFKLLWSSFKSGWRFIQTHILSNDYLNDPEYILMNKLKDSAEDLKAFDLYRRILKPRNLNWMWEMAPIERGFNGGLVKKDGVGFVTIEGEWSNHGYTLKLKVGRIFQNENATVKSATKKQLVIWQDMGAFVHTEETSLHDSHEEYTWNLFVRASQPVLAQVEFHEHGLVQYIAPFRLAAGKGTFSFEVNVRELADRKLAGKLAIQALTASVKHQPEVGKNEKNGSTRDGCAEKSYGVYDVKLRVQSRVDVWEEGYWGEQEFGTVAPWGVDLHKQGQRMSKELFNQIPQDKCLTNINLIPHDSLVKLFLLGRTNSLNWRRKCEQFKERTQADLNEPSLKALEILRTPIINEFIAVVLSLKHKSIYYEDAAVPESEGGNAVLLQALHDIASLVPVEILQKIHGAKKQYHDPEDDTLARQKMADAAARFTSETSIQTDVHKSGSFSSLPVPENKTWVLFKGRKNKECKRIFKDVMMDSLDLCRQLAEKHCNHAKSNHDCNLVRFQPKDEEEKKEGVCSIWHCLTFDHMIPDSEFDLMALMAVEANPEKASPMEIVASIPAWTLKSCIEELHERQLKRALEGVSHLSAAKSIWKERVLNRAIKPSNNSDPGKIIFRYIKTSWLRKELMVKLLFSRRMTTWLDGLQFSMMLGSLDNLKTDDTKVEVTLRSGRNGDSKHTAELVVKGGDLRGRRWDETVGLKWTDIAGTECMATVKISFATQPAVQPGYFLRPNLIPVVRAFFSAYDQFVSKLPLYAEQVQGRLLPKEDGMFDYIKSILPYTETDGRFLHRHLKKGEQDKLKVHEGELGTDDAVYNIEKALRKSKHKTEPHFLYNAGLSIANLFLRIVSDVQALFFIYFANHPDWDGKCTSLPPRFRLFHEFNNKEGPYSSYRSNWGFTPDQYSSKDTHPNGYSHKLPKMRAKMTVAEHGEKFTKEDSSLFLDWHWVSAPHRFGSDKKRANFFARTPPVHGKDGWASPNIKQSSAVVWPHLWCELVHGFWVKDESEVVREALGSEEEIVLQSIKELMMEFDHECVEDACGVDLQQTSAYRQEFKRSMLKAEEALKTPPLKCAEMMAVYDKGENASTSLVENWKMIRDASTWIAQLHREALDLVKTDIEKGEGAPREVELDEESTSTKKTEKDVGADTEAGQLSTLGEIMESLETRHSQEFTSIKSLAKATEDLWKATSAKNQHAQAVQARHKMEKVLNEVEVSLVEKERHLKQVQEQLESLLADYPRTKLESFDGVEELDPRQRMEQEMSDNLAQELIGDMRYAGPLLKAIMRLQLRTVAEFRLLQSCILLNLRPAPLSPTRFWPWAVGKPGNERLDGLLEYMDNDALKGLAADGIDLFFEDACKVPLNFKPEEQDKNSEEPRHECERVTMHTALFTIFPTFAEKVVKQFRYFEEELKNLRAKPVLSTVQKFREDLIDFMANLPEGFDTDFYTAFAYRQDGSLFGDLWATLGDATTKIESNLEDRKADHKAWISEGVLEAEALKNNRRMKVRKPTPPEPDIPAMLEGCICQPKWTVWHRPDSYGLRSGLWWREHYEGCVKKPAHRMIGYKREDIAGYKGICRGKQKVNDVDCAGKGDIIACDPNITADTRPQYGIWRKSDIHHRHLITLPLLRMDFFAHFDVRNFRADFCTPNFASLMVDVNLVWSTQSWISWEKRFSVCGGLRIHPPGFFIYVSRCQHYEYGKVTSNDTDTVKNHEWQLVFVFYIVSYYNTWGTGDGDDLKSWFGSDGSGFGAGDNWAHKIADRGPGIFLQDSTWRTPGDGEGFGYTMNVEEATLGPSGIFLTIMAEMTAAFVTSKAMAAVYKKGGEQTEHREGEKKKGRWFHMSKSGAFTILYGVAKFIWMMLKNAGKIPSNWDMGISVKGITKALSKKGLEISGFRNEHDIILTMRGARSVRTLCKPQSSTISYLAYPQMEHLFSQFKEAGMPIEAQWNDWLSQAGHDLEEASQLSRPAVQDLVDMWMEHLRVRKPLNWLFQGCERPIWYKVAATEEGVYAFFGKDHSTWVKPKIEPGTLLFLIRDDQDWFKDITTTAREDQFFPQTYIKRGALIFEADSDQFRTTASEAFREVTKEDIQNLIYSTPLKPLQCWANRIITDHGDSLREVQASYDVPIKLFRKDYAREFLKKTWAELKGCAALVGKNSSGGGGIMQRLTASGLDGADVCSWKDEEVKAKADEIYKKMLQVFDRGQGSTFKFSAGKNTDIQQRSHTTYSFDVGLTMQFRIGFSFLRAQLLSGALPMQVQPYMQLQLSYDVRQIIQSIYLRFVNKKKSSPSMLQLHKKRKNRCSDCVKAGKAFCDRRESAEAMLTDGFQQDSMDQCMDINLEEMDDCKAFKWNGFTGSSGYNANPGASIFTQYVCPCFDEFQGGLIMPQWITSEARCNELALPGREDEKSRRTQKRSDFHYGFATQRRLNLGNSLSYPEKAGCREKFKCCVAFKPDGSEISRCVDHQYIRSLTITGYRSKCKNFHPPDVTIKDDWSHQRQWFRCGTRYPSFDGHWTKESKIGQWVDVETLEV